MRKLPSSVMAARNQPLGFDHTTVVPANFEPDTEQGTGDDRFGSAERD